MPQKFFITHTWKDVEFSRRLFDDLVANGLEGFLDDQSIQGGHRLAEQINRGLEWCDVYIPVLSHASIESPWCWEEINAAIALSNQRGRNGCPTIIPVVIDDCALPALLSSRLYFNFGGNYENALNELLVKGFGVNSTARQPNAMPLALPQILERRQSLPIWFAIAGAVIFLFVCVCSIAGVYVWNVMNASTLAPTSPAVVIEPTSVTPTSIFSSTPGLTPSSTDIFHPSETWTPKPANTVRSMAISSPKPTDTVRPAVISTTPKPADIVPVLPSTNTPTKTPTNTPTNTPANIWTVTKAADTNDGVCNADCSLREAIAAAAPGGIINFSPNLSGQIITLGSTLTLAKNVTIDGSSLVAQVTVSGNNAVQVFNVSPGINVTLKNLIISRGKNAGGNGGGISNSGTLTVMNSVFDHNDSPLGGGIYSEITGSLTVNNCLFSNNNSGSGGGILNRGYLNVTDSSFSGNTAGQGGGMWNGSNARGASITNSFFSGNSASGNGGGILNYVSNLSISNSTFYGNISVTNGGAITNNEELTGYSVTVTNSTFSSNKVTGAGSGGVIQNDYAGATFRNSILANSVTPRNCDGVAIVDGGNNLQYGGTIANSCGTTIPTSSSDPLGGNAPANNGGPTQTIALPAGSAAINKIPSAGGCGAGITTDQRGVARPQGAQCDIGAYEYPYP